MARIFDIDYTPIKSGVLKNTLVSFKVEGYVSTANAIRRTMFELPVERLLLTDMKTNNGLINYIELQNWFLGLPLQSVPKKLTALRVSNDTLEDTRIYSTDFINTCDKMPITVLSPGQYLEVSFATTKQCAEQDGKFATITFEHYKRLDDISIGNSGNTAIHSMAFRNHGEIPAKSLIKTVITLLRDKFTSCKQYIPDIEYTAEETVLTIPGETYTVTNPIISVMMDQDAELMYNTKKLSETDNNIMLIITYPPNALTKSEVAERLMEAITTLIKQCDNIIRRLP